MNPNQADYSYNLGIAYQRLLMRDKSIAAYQKACALAPGDDKYQSALRQVR